LHLKHKINKLKIKRRGGGREKKMLLKTDTEGYGRV
jgi:hypothetical protein